MALDPQLVVTRYSAAELAAGVPAAHASKWHVLGAGGPSALTLVRVGTGALDFRSQSLGRGTPYEFLERAGVIGVAGDISRGALRLAGGSVSTCTLFKSEESWIVEKRVMTSALHEIDSRQRHAAEAAWIGCLPDTARNLFPSVAYASDKASFQVRMPFIPNYTLGEQLLQGRFDSDAVKQIVASVFSQLSGALYVHKTSLQSPEYYVERVARRFTELQKHRQMEAHVHAMFTQTCIVNGKECRPVREQLNAIESAAAPLGAVRPTEFRMCHGDLIPEDVLYDSASKRTHLVDPNPQNADPLADLGKMAMSFLLRYDYAFRDWFSFSAGGLGNRHPEYQLGIRELAGGKVDFEAVGRWVCEFASTLIERDVLPAHRVEPRAVLLMAGLQALAIPIFHAVHHGKPLRALYFMGMGKLLTESALGEYGV